MKVCQLYKDEHQRVSLLPARAGRFGSLLFGGATAISETGESLATILQREFQAALFASQRPGLLDLAKEQYSEHFIKNIPNFENKDVQVMTSGDLTCFSKELLGEPNKE